MTRWLALSVGILMILNLIRSNESLVFFSEETASLSTPPAEWPQASDVVGGIPVYQKFSELEPIFHFDNDTTYVINFWATWCKPCIVELPYFESLHEKYRSEKVRVVLVSLDFPSKIESKLVPYVEKKGLQSTVVALLDGKFNDWIDKVSPEWSGAIPVTYIYKGGTHKFVNDAFDSMEEIEAVMQSLP